MENKTVQKINKSCDIEKRGFLVNFLYFRYVTPLQETIIARMLWRRLSTR